MNFMTGNVTSVFDRCSYFLSSTRCMTHHYPPVNFNAQPTKNVFPNMVRSSFLFEEIYLGEELKAEIQKYNKII